MNKLKIITEAMKKNNQLRIAEIENMAHPWTYEIFKQYYFLNSTKVDDLIKDSDVGKIWSDLADLSQMVLILLVSIDEFFDELAMVDNRNNNDIFFTKSTKTQLNIQSKLALKLFNCTGVLMALVDQARVFNDKHVIIDYKEKISHYIDSELHTFLQNLRNFMMHKSLAKIALILNYDFSDTPSRKTEIFLPKSTLIEFDNWTNPAKAFLDGCDWNVNISDVLLKYRRQIQNFYCWHKSKVLIEYNDKIQFFLQYKSYIDSIRNSTNFNLLISQSNPNNFLQNLLEYLSESEIEKLFSYEYKSERQFTFLFNIIDPHGLFDSKLIENIKNLW